MKKRHLLLGLPLAGMLFYKVKMETPEITGKSAIETSDAHPQKVKIAERRANTRKRVTNTFQKTPEFDAHIFFDAILVDEDEMSVLSEIAMALRTETGINAYQSNNGMVLMSRRSLSPWNVLDASGDIILVNDDREEGGDLEVILNVSHFAHMSYGIPGSISGGYEEEPSSVSASTMDELAYKIGEEYDYKACQKITAQIPHPR